jgi:hypothetical protein
MTGFGEIAPWGGSMMSQGQGRGNQGNGFGGGSSLFGGGSVLDDIFSPNFMYSPLISSFSLERFEKLHL